MLSLFDKTGREISDQTQYFNNPTYLGEPWCSGWGICKEMYKAANETSGSEMEEEQYDKLFLVLEEPQGGYTVPPPSVNHTPSTSSLQRFAPPKSDKEVEAARKASMPKKTRNDMDYCMRIWMEWKECRNIKTETTAMTKVELNEALCRFVVEIRKKDGSEYPPNNVHHIYCGIMRYLRTEGQPQINFFSDRSFIHFREVLDSEMK